MGKSSRFVIFGDSWPRGDELNPGEKTFGEILSIKFGCDSFENYSAPASSISHMTVQLKSFLQKLKDVGGDPTEYTALFCLTAEERSMVYYNNYWMFQTAGGGFSYTKDNELCQTINASYWKYFYSPEQLNLIANTNILCFQTLCQQYGINDYYVAGWQKFNCWPEINLEKFYKQGQISCADFINVTVTNGAVDRDNPYISPNPSKPNQAGHTEIANRLYEWMSCARQI